MTNGDMGDEKITVMHLLSDINVEKRTRQPSRILKGYEVEGYLVRTDSLPVEFSEFVQFRLIHSKND